MDINGGSMIYRKSVIAPRARVLFDAANVDHLKDYAQFLKLNTWKNGCSYLLEDPYEDIPTMINAKVVAHFLADYMV